MIADIPACETMVVIPPALRTASRATKEFGAAENVTVPFPAPLTGEVNVIQEAELVTVQGASEGVAVTVTVPVPPAAGIPVGVTEIE